MTFLAILVALQLAPSPHLLDVQDWANHVRVSRYDPAGFPCYDQALEPRQEVARLYFKTPLYRLDDEPAPPDTVHVRVGKKTCFAPTDVVGQLHTRPFSCLKDPPAQPLTSLTRLLDVPVPDPNAGTTLGPLFPTFYQIADERLYPGDPARATTLLDNQGQPIADVSKEYRRALLRQGTGMIADGRVLNVGSKHRSGRRFIVLPKGSYGLGTSGYHLYPYRSVAVDFDYLCDRLGDADLCRPGNTGVRDRQISRANRKALAGMLLYLPRLAGVVLDDGAVHDGFVCAVDVGGGIKLDRIDIFVGADAAGNPYYPPCRSENAFLRAGIESLIPSDWRTFERDDDGNYTRSVPDEYRRVAPEKGLTVTAFPALRCQRKTR